MSALIVETEVIARITDILHLRRRILTSLALVVELLPAGA
jgi:hypothetical protein